MNRRNFLKLTGLAVAGVTVGVPAVRTIRTIFLVHGQIWDRSSIDSRKDPHAMAVRFSRKFDMKGNLPFGEPVKVFWFDEVRREGNIIIRNCTDIQAKLIGGKLRLNGS